MSIGYLDGSALAEAMRRGDLSRRVIDVWRALDAACVHEFVQIEVPSLAGRELDRMAWIWGAQLLDPNGA